MPEITFLSAEPKKGKLLFQAVGKGFSELLVPN
jgi:hypothetical protein